MQARPAVKGFVAAFLGVFLVCGVADVELWPFTGWRLFSRIRTEYLRDWAATVPDGAGAEVPVPFAELPQTYSYWRHLAERLPGMGRAEQDAVCGEWADAAGRPGGVRVYLVEESLADPQDVRRRLWFACP